MSDNKKNTNNKMSHTQVSKARRKVLTTFAIGGGVVAASQAPHKWVKPVLNSVILPAHAQTSVTAPSVNQTFNTVGAASFTVPDGITSLQISISGGGGGGGGAAAGDGGLGGAGELVNTTLAVTPGQVLSIVVGAGGTGGAGFSGTGGFGATGGGLSSIEGIVASGGGGAGGEGPPASATAGTAGAGPNGGTAGAATVGTNAAGNGGDAGAGGGSAGGAGGVGCCFPGAGNPGVDGSDGFVTLTS
ncbi:MAG: hypothetical protein ACRBHB_19775 [Arenicella sp.]